MESVLRRFGLKKGEHRESEARLKLQKELFAFNKCVKHGFPNKPSALAYDPKSRLMAIGTKSGAIAVYGTPGVEFVGQHQEDVSVTQIIFLPGQARLITLCSDNSLHLWEANSVEGTASLDEVRHLSMEASKLRTVTASCLTSNSEQVYLGTEGGNIHVLQVNSFKLTDQIIYQETVIQNVPDDFKLNPGAVESIIQHPAAENKFLIGYNRGLIVLWDSQESNAEHTYNASQQLESVAWYKDGTQFMSAHADGSYIIWSTSDSTKPKEQATTPYGPFPCKAITKIQWKTAKPEPYILFSGGMPRASYGDRHTVSVMQGNMHQVFDFTSRVVDFITFNSADELADYDRTEYDDPHSIIVLAEEELVAIDLQSEGWQTYRSPYLWSLHSSAITCANHITNTPEALWTKITDAGELQFQNVSGRDWPVAGGKNMQSNITSRDLLLTGHEDGSVRFWDASTSSMRLMYKLSTSQVFGTEGPADQSAVDGDEEWPPFRKVGTFDPYSDDPRLAVQKISMCALSETLVLAGTAGQVIVLQFEREEREQEVKVTAVNVVSDRDNFVWKGHEALPVKGGDVKFAAGFQPVCVVQLQPPAAVTALALHSEWQLISAGTAHGLGVFDYSQKNEVSTKCTLNPADLTGTGESSMSRRKSFKKSLRESFRRLRKRRSERRRRAQQEHHDPKVEEQKAEAKPEGEAASQEAPAAGSSTEASAAQPVAEPHPAVADSPKPVERQIEFRDTNDSMASMVRCLYFADTYLLNTQNHTPTLWAGTNAGTVYIFQITMPATDKRDTESVQCVLAKEIQLKHRAPVISVCVIDRTAQPLPAPLEVTHERAKAPDMTGGHHVVICSEEQFKIFTLPSLKANNKYKLTAHEGSKVRKIGFVNFRSRSDERYAENDLACMTNTGEVQVFSIPQLRRQIKADCVRKDNVSGIVSSVFAQHGEGFFLASPSEVMRYSLSARFVSKPLCRVDLAEGARPELEPEEVVVEQAAEPAAAAAAAAEGDAAQETQAASGEGDAAKSDDEKKDEPNDSVVASGDTTIDSANVTVDSANMTADSVRVHLSEEVSSSSRVTKTVVTKTMVSETTNDGTVTHESQTVQQTVTMSGTEGAASGAIEGATGESGGGAGAGPSNLDDDTKLTKQVPEETTEAAEQLPELHISEEGDEDKTGKTTAISSTSQSVVVTKHTERHIETHSSSQSDEAPVVSESSVTTTVVKTAETNQTPEATTTLVTETVTKSESGDGMPEVVVTTASEEILQQPAAAEENEAVAAVEHEEQKEDDAPAADVPDSAPVAEAEANDEAPVEQEAEATVAEAVASPKEHEEQEEDKKEEPESEPTAASDEPEHAEVSQGAAASAKHDADPSAEAEDAKSKDEAASEEQTQATEPASPDSSANDDDSLGFPVTTPETETKTETDEEPSPQTETKPEETPSQTETETEQAEVSQQVHSEQKVNGSINQEKEADEVKSEKEKVLAKGEATQENGINSTEAVSQE